MKKILAFLLSVIVIIVFLSGTLGAVAEDLYEESEVSENEFANDIRHKGGVFFSCTFDASTSSVNLEGTISHDLLIQYRDHTIEMYAIPLGESAASVVFDPNSTAIAETAIAVRFQFSKKISGIIEKYYSYCVVFCSPDGERILATDSKYAEVGSDFSYDPNVRNAYKGIETEMISSAANAGAGRAIIPIDINKLISEASSGYIYQANNENIYFEKNYIEALDSKVRTLTAAGAELYFRILIKSEGKGISIKNYGEGVCVPNVYDEKTLSRIEASISFLTDRYENNQSGILNGIIIGKAIDDISSTLFDKGEYSAYVDMYTLYTIVVANSSRQQRPDIDIVISFSDKNILNDIQVSMLEDVISRFDYGVGSGLNCSIIIESSTSPLIMENNKVSLKSTEEKLQAQNMYLFDEYLSGLQERFESAPKSFMFCWSVNDSVHANEIGPAYAYSYLKLAECKLLASFVISLTEEESVGVFRGFREIKHVFEHIDTDERGVVLDNILDNFSEPNWENVLSRSHVVPPVLRNISFANNLDSLPSGVIGEFTYFDFSKSVAFNDWFKGELCKELRLDHSEEGMFLKADMSASERGEYSELLCLYEYPENLEYTPYIAINCKIETSDNNSKLFEIIVSGGQGLQRITSSKTVYSGKTTTVLLNISEYSHGITDSMKIGVRSLDGDISEFSLQIYDIVGYSEEYDNDALASKIEEDRAFIRNQLIDSDDGINSYTVIIITVAVLVIALGIGVFICIRQGEYTSEKDKE